VMASPEHTRHDHSASRPLSTDSGRGNSGIIKGRCAERPMIGPVFLQDVEVVVDVTDQANPPRQQQHGTDSSGTEALDPIGELVVDVARGDHRLFAIWPRAVRNAVEDSALSLP
jgi:hypothetical protein